MDVAVGAQPIFMASSCVSVRTRYCLGYSFVRCGRDGFRGIGWPDTPPVRGNYQHLHIPAKLHAVEALVSIGSPACIWCR